MIDGKFYSSQEELFNDLKKIEYCDLRSDKTAVKDAVKFCVNVMRCFAMAEYIVPNQEKLQVALYKLGACEYNRANPKFLPIEDSRIVNVLDKKDNIQFPLGAMNQVFGSSSYNFSANWERIVEGGKDSWAQIWLTAQDTHEAQVENA